MRNELRDFVRKVGREEVLASIMEGLSQHEQATLLRSMPHFGLLLALTGDAFTALPWDAQCVSSRVEAHEWARRRGKKHEYEQGFTVHFDLVFGDSKPKPVGQPKVSCEPDIYIAPNLIQVGRRLSQ